MAAFPMRFFVRFLHNHGMLSVNDRPVWRVVKGGSKTYVDAITRPFRDRIRLNTPVERVVRHPDRVEVSAGGETESYDQVIIAAHSDEALRLLGDPSDAERSVLGAIPYQPNDVILHTDTSLMPRRRLAWASWNYHLPMLDSGEVSVTYHMNNLQSLEAKTQFMVSLNCRDRIAPEKILGSWQYHHPLMTVDGVQAQSRWDEINGVNRTWFAGAYWRHGFHEDGVVSGLRVVDALIARGEGTNDAVSG